MVLISYTSQSQPATQQPAVLELMVLLEYLHAVATDYAIDLTSLHESSMKAQLLTSITY